MGIARKLMSGMFNGLAAAKLDLSPELKSYMETALWAETDNADESGGELLDKNYGIDDLAPEAIEKMRRDVEKFFADNDSEINRAMKVGMGKSAEEIAHDFWLTRNGHGAGFWDGDYPKDIGDNLTKASKKFGEQNIYVGDDGKLHVD